MSLPPDAEDGAGLGSRAAKGTEKVQASARKTALPASLAGRMLMARMDRLRAATSDSAPFYL